MAWRHSLILFTIHCMAQGSPMNGGGVKTCPGFPGYCSESYPGDTCLVVCAFGRNNVPECQADGTWTDIPRCIEHEPGIPEQVPGLCPGIPGYCSIDYPGGVCEFDCLSGPDIRSFCTPDGTWDPYPTCDGDVRETRDGCNPCPGPFGGPRNRTSEGASGSAPAKNKAGQQRNQANPVQSAAPVNNNRPGQGGAKQHPTQAPRGNSAPRNGNGNAKPKNGNGNGSGNSNGGQPKHGNGGQKNGNGGNNNRNGNGGQKNGNSSGQNRGSGGSPQGHPKQPQQQAQNQKPSPSQGQGNQVSSGAGGTCPGGSLESCIDVCPSDSARIFGACVNGCAKRCPSKK